MSGLRIERGEDQGRAIDRLADRLGGRVGVGSLLGDLSRRARRTWAPGLAVRRAWTWDTTDRRDPTWWPQGVSTSADADPSERVAGRRLLAMTWYSKREEGSRITFLDLDSRRYEHVLLVRADGDVSPVRVHAGGLLWCGPWLHVAATARGFVSCRLDDLIHVPDDADLATYGHRYVLPVRTSYVAGTEEGAEPLRYSFLGVDRDGPALTVGEYAGDDGRTRRLVRWALDPDSLLPVIDTDGVARPLSVEEGPAHMQGAAYVAGRWHLSLSHGRRRLGTVVTGAPGSWRRHRWAMPMGPEDLSWWPSSDRLWTVTEYPPRRWVVEVRRPQR